MNFQLNPQSVGSTKILSSLDAVVKLFDPDIDLEIIGYGISEEFLRFDLKDNFLPRIGPYCQKS